jgi:hypothetical protein
MGKQVPRGQRGLQREAFLEGIWSAGREQPVEQKKKSY